jgi:sugar/nucleoside kinase (ribokinase family)
MIGDDKVIDTTGAGDAFIAGFLAGHIHHHSPSVSLKMF